MSAYWYKPLLLRCFCFMVAAFCWQAGIAQKVIVLNDLSGFQNPGSNWHTAGGVQVKFLETDHLAFNMGNGIIANVPEKAHSGKDLFSQQQFGDVDLEIDYLMAKGSNSGIYLQGNYEVQLLDSWGVINPKAGDNGGIYERWDEARPEGQKGYEGYPPRQNVSRAPGLWQHLKIVFQAPRFVNGKKTENARMLQIELNGILIHEDVELSGSTRGGGEEKPLGSLRIQGDHGPMAFKNLSIKAYEPSRPVAAEENQTRNLADPILITAESNTTLRSFVDIPGNIRVTHSVSVGSPLQVHYTYDQDYGSIAQLWRGGFLDATPMWHERGDGSSRPLGSVQYFGNPALTLAKLPVADAPWPLDTAGSGFRAKGYVLDDQDVPTFKYQQKGMMVSDAISVSSNSQGIHRQISLSAVVDNLYIRLAQGNNIESLSNGLYLINDRGYYLQLDKPEAGIVMIREGVNGQKELIVPLKQSIGYRILF
jgi:hypothetical protein